MPERYDIGESYDIFRWKLPDGTQALMTVWPDGHAEIAYRQDEHETWGAPRPVEHLRGKSV